jgi:hypothetical protein
MSNFKIGQTVRYKYPILDLEEELRFTVKEIHEPDGNLGEKILVELICEGFMKPTFHHFSAHYEPVN